MMKMAEKRNPGWRAGASEHTRCGHGLSVNGAEALERMQYRLSANACAIDALTPDLDFAMQAAELLARGMPLPGDGRQRLHRLALRLFDARTVLEAPLPPEVHR